MGKSLTHDTYDTAAYNDMGESLTHDTYDTAAYNDVKMAINKRTEEERKKVEEEISIRGGFRRDWRTPMVSTE
uniref:Uncharacterized protein n=1 Tax=Salix viminalis TaxID=40686 RepID=A0A6N2NBT2_SALVM